MPYFTLRVPFRRLYYNKDMIELNIPGRGILLLEHLVLDVNGTLAVDGQLNAEVEKHIDILRKYLEIHLITADTHGKQQTIDEQLNLKAVRLDPGDEAGQKAGFVRKLGSLKTAAIGQGANDAKMLKEAALGICVGSKEGTSTETILASDLYVQDIINAFELLEKPQRLVATLRK